MLDALLAQSGDATRAVDLALGAGGIAFVVWVIASFFRGRRDRRKD